MTGSAPTTARRRAERRGRAAEWIAVAWLLLKGYRILARRARLAAGELDIVARRGRRLVFVEVKRRADRRAAIESVGPAARRRIHTAARHWIAARGGAHDAEVRFDIIAVAPGHLPLHIRDAWRP